MIEHKWVLKNGDPNSFYKMRECPVCGLDDRRLVDGFLPGPLSNWTVTTPCIIPVEGPVCLEDLQAILDYHKVEKKLSWRGAEGAYEVGFSVPSGIYPCLKARRLEIGFAELLRWLRARDFDVYRYSLMLLREHDGEYDSLPEDGPFYSSEDLIFGVPDK